MCYLLREQHQTEVSAMEDKVKWLELELEKTKKSSNESTVQFQTKVGNLIILFLGSQFSHFNHMKTDNTLISRLFCCWIIQVPVYTTPEKFENGGFTLKTLQMFSAEGIWNATITGHFEFAFQENSGWEITLLL